MKCSIHSLNAVWLVFHFYSRLKYCVSLPLLRWHIILYFSLFTLPWIWTASLIQRALLCLSCHLSLQTWFARGCVEATSSLCISNMSEQEDLEAAAILISTTWCKVHFMSQEGKTLRSDPLSAWCGEQYTQLPPRRFRSTVNGAIIKQVTVEILLNHCIHLFECRISIPDMFPNAVLQVHSDTYKPFTFWRSQQQFISCRKSAGNTSQLS